MEESGEFSDELDEFEESFDQNAKAKAVNKNRTTYQDKPYDEAYEISQDLSMAESFDARGQDKKGPREQQFKNEKYDEAVEISQSIDQVAMSAAAPKAAARSEPGAGGNNNNNNVGSEDKDHKGGMKKGADQTKSQTVLNNKFDEALEFSRSGSEESFDTRASQKKSAVAAPSTAPIAHSAAPQTGPGLTQDNYNANDVSSDNDPSPMKPQHQEAKGVPQPSPKRSSEDGGASSDEEGEHEESYDNIEGAYNAKDYLQLNVTSEVRDLFQYIERYKPQEVELDTPLKCFIPEYIPAIGELDAFIKVPRPDGKDDGLGLKYLDEPSTTQSDPTVLELQLRAKSKRLQYGDVVVRSIENADKNPAKIEKWIQDISELHRSKPPPQVNYKKNMPDTDQLMEMWPEEFEQFLLSNPLPSPDLDLTLAEYAKTLCSLVDIPTYDNPIESLHLMFTLFIEFRNNPHFQQRMANDADPSKGFGTDRNRGQGADVMEIEQDYKSDHK